MAGDSSASVRRVMFGSDEEFMITHSWYPIMMPFCLSLGGGSHVTLMEVELIA